MNTITNSFDLTFRQLSFQLNFLISYFKTISYFKIISYFRAISLRKIMSIRHNRFNIKIVLMSNSSKQNKQQTYRHNNRVYLFRRKRSFWRLIWIKIKKISQKTRSISFVDFLIKQIQIKLIDKRCQFIMLNKTSTRMITSKTVRRIFLRDISVNLKIFLKITTSLSTF